MVKLLVTNGCSCTRGEELRDPASHAWPTLLGDALGIDVVNLARDGSSNRRVVRSTVARLADVCADRRLRPQEVMVLPAWTQSSRHEYHAPREKPEVRTGPADGPGDRGWQRIGPWRQDAGHKPSRAFYDHLWSEEGQLANFFLDWALLDAFLRQGGFHARYAFAFPLTGTVPDLARPFTRTLEEDTVWGGLPPRPGHSFLEMPDGLARGPGGHPLEEGHAWFAASLGKWLSA
ncbi:DUF6071 family protein [Streptomyces sp. NPDC060020]|uniref:DUF6071 family protein n=1 Tax=Streptomyces sp. NPDC060020 TaxID=3347038 RepID=UPI0036B53639